MVLEDRQLSAEQRKDAIATFRAVTSVDNDEDAERILQSSAWQLDRAVSEYLDNPDAAVAPITNTPSADHATQATDSQPRLNQAVTQPAAVHRLPRWLLTLLSPFRVVWSFLSNLTTHIINLLSGPAHLIESSPGSTPMRRFLSFYESRHGTEHPEFFDGTYQAALSSANAQLKFLLVYIHSESHRLTPSFTRSILAHPEFIETADRICVTWAGSITQREGAAVYHALRAPALPYLAVVVSPTRSGSDMDVAQSQFGMVLSQRAGPPGHAAGGTAAAQWIERVAQRHAGLLETVRAERAERESARLLRQQQDEEYAAALEADRRAEREVERKRAEKEQEEARLEELEVRRARKKEELGDEPEKGPGVASVVIRLPDGNRVGRRFLQTDRLEKVFDWAEVNRVDIEVASLVVAFPRKSFNFPEDGDQTILEAGLFPSGMLLLEERSG